MMVMLYCLPMMMVTGGLKIEDSKDVWLSEVGRQSQTCWQVLTVVDSMRVTHGRIRRQSKIQRYGHVTWMLHNMYMLMGRFSKLGQSQ